MDPANPSPESSTSSSEGGDLALLPHHLEQLRATSGLTLATLRQVPISSVTDGEAARRDLCWRPGGARRL